MKFVDPVPPLDAGVDGAEAVGPVLAKATAPHPADRFGSVAEFVAAWRTAVAGPDLVRTTGDDGVPRPWAGRWRRPWPAWGSPGSTPTRACARSRRPTPASSAAGPSW